MTVVRLRQINSTENLKKGTGKVVTAVVLMTEEAFDVSLEMLTRPTLKTDGSLEEVGIKQIVVMPLAVWPKLKKGRMEEVGIKKVVTAVIVVTKKTAVVVVTVL